MNLRLALALGALLSAVPITALAAPPQPPAEIVNLANAVIAATNADDASGLANIYTSNATVVDESAPFAWNGATAGAQWWHVVDGTVAKMKLTHLKAVASAPSEFQQSATDAYMIVPVKLTGNAPNKPFTESGTMTYTFHKTETGWKISTQVWTTKP